MEPPEECRRLTSPEPPVITHQPGAEHCKLDVPVVVIHPGIKKSGSMTSISTQMREKFRQKREKFRQNQCAGIITFLILGTMLNVFAYLASVWSAQLQQEVVKTAVENEHTYRFKLKKALAEAPSKYLIGLLNFGGRVMSALGIVLLVQVVATYMKRRRYGVIMRSAAEEADTFIGDMHGGVTDAVGECCLGLYQGFV